MCKNPAIINKIRFSKTTILVAGILAAVIYPYF
jgi:hypothetical protein